jgi:hypothetical protein
MTPAETWALLGALALLVALVPLTAYAVDALLARHARRAHERAVDAFLAGRWRDVADERDDR